MNRLRVGFWLLALVLGALHAWAGRHSMNPDGISYLDLADAYLRHGSGAALNAYWSPLYPLLIGLGFRALEPSPYWEFPVVHLVNFAIYVFSLGCFDFFLRQLIRFTSRPGPESIEGGHVTLPDWALITLGYPIFIWSSLYLMTLSDVTPDILVAAFVYLNSGLLLRIRGGATSWLTFLGLGVALGFGYLTKAIMFPLSLIFLVLAVFSTGNILRTLPRVSLSFIIFLFIGAPLLINFSQAKNRFTFGDSGRLAYVWGVNAVPYPHWKGGPSEVGTPRHPTRQIFDDPAVYEFATPYKTTYAPWYDPTYWYEGVSPHFDFLSQIKRLRSNLSHYYYLFFNNMHYALMVGLLTLYLMGRKWSLMLRGLAGVWTLPALAITALGIYSLVWVEARYVGVFPVLMWISLFSAVRLPDIPGARRAVGSVALAVAAMTIVTIIVSTSSEARATARDLIRGEKASDNVHWQVAEGLRRLGVQPGDEVAHVGHSFTAYWARLARVRVIAEVEQPEQFWAADDSVRHQVFDKLSRTGAKVLVTENLPSNVTTAGWQRFDDTGYHVYRLSD